MAPGLQPVSLATEINVVADQIAAWSEQQSRWALISRQTEGDNIAIHLTRTTPIFRFVDDIHVVLSKQQGGTRVDARSQSRVGKGDLGQNPRNLKELTGMLSQSSGG